MCCDEVFYNLGCMDSGAIPDQFDIPRDLATKLSKKINNKASIEILIGRKQFGTENLHALLLEKA